MAKSTETDTKPPASRAADFTKVQNAEIKAINERREKNGRGRLPPIPDNGNGDDRKIQDVNGLAFSGGGIRSAAISLGALQALNQHETLKNIDYISSVSGGGYMASSLSATMSATDGEFVYANESEATPKDRPKASEVKDTESVGHIRNYSNYLMPGGFRDVLTAAAIIARGLVANFALVFPIVLYAAALTVWSNPNRSSLHITDFFGAETIMFHGINIVQLLPVENFGLTLLTTLIGFVSFLTWALWRSIFRKRDASEFRTSAPFLGAIWLVVIAFVFFCELQPFVVAGMFDVAEGGGVFAFLTRWVTTLAAIATPVAAVVTIFRQQIGSTIKSADTTSSLSVKLLGLGSRAAIWIAGAAVPLLIWVVYLYLSYWGIINDQFVAKATNSENAVVHATAPPAARPHSHACLYTKPPQSPPRGPVDGSHTPDWLLSSAENVSNIVYGCTVRRPMGLLYLCVGLILWFLSLFLGANANSLHRLYRDRLSKGFLFDPGKRMKPNFNARNTTSPDQGRDFKPLDMMQLSKIKTGVVPYHLINAALNIQGSDYANRRGRNADFFLFSPQYVGSRATGYAKTTTMEQHCADLDLATAMAISGAAVSSNMGSLSIRPLTATLALLNIRLGYWLHNPKYVNGDVRFSSVKKFLQKLFLGFLWAEITGRLYENSEEIYLTDGGHIENLGVYELLRRRCKLIVAVDADCDPEMNFASLITLQRYARIDLGIRIDLPFNILRETTLANMKSPTIVERIIKRGDKLTEPKLQKGPHATVGTIDYGSGNKGVLLYIKSSLTGDENDYVRAYARRYNQFPHEDTGDQFFSEEQFEVYRALGFHMVHGALSGEHLIEAAGSTTPVNFRTAKTASVKAAREALAPAE